MASIFSKIIQGQIPSYKIYEDEHVYAFLDINPINPGHTLIVPKTEVDYYVDVPEPYYSAVFRAAKKIGQAIHDATDCKRVGLTVLGWDVPHFHLHVVPMFGVGELDFRRAKKIPETEMKKMQVEIVRRIS